MAARPEVLERDTDNDTIQDHRDNDSDNDGCLDALESNGNFTLDDVDTNGKLTGSVDATTGIPTSAGVGQTNVSAYDNTITGDQCDDDGDSITNIIDVCEGSNDALDYDNDGVPDGCDQDDDNDGILDTLELGCSTTTTTSYAGWDFNNAISKAKGTIYDTNNIVTVEDYISGANILLTDDETRLYIDNADQLDLRGAIVDEDFIQFELATKSEAKAAMFNSMQYRQANRNILNHEYFVSVLVSNDGFLTSQLLIKDFYITISGPGGQKNIPANTTPYYLSASTSYQIRIYFYNLKNKNNRAIIDDILFIVDNCSEESDIDRDRVANYRDNDSDNDGCLDALEGNSNFTLNDVATNGQLTGGVDATTGIPTSAGIGQTNVSAYERTITGDQCDDDNDGVPNAADICDGFDDNLDNDTDGVPDGCDQDDDNDVILDSTECPISTINRALTAAASHSTLQIVGGPNPASNAIDDDLNTFSHTDNITTTNWLEVDLGSIQNIDDLIIYNRSGTEQVRRRLSNAYVMIATNAFATGANGLDITQSLANADFKFRFRDTRGVFNKKIPVNISARYVRVQLSGDNYQNYIHLEELQVLDYSLCPNMDADLLPNYLDNDSDNDGCFDALEGDDNFTLNDVDTNGQLMGDIDTATGIPEAAGSGQNDISAYDNAITGDQCDDDSSRGTPPVGSSRDIEVVSDLLSSNNNNGIFQINAIELFPNNTVRIYNRWGVIVYETQGYDNDKNVFKGISKGRTTIQKSEELPVGVYFYTIDYMNKEQAKSKTGYLYINE